MATGTGTVTVTMATTAMETAMGMATVTMGTAMGTVTVIARFYDRSVPNAPTSATVGIVLESAYLIHSVTQSRSRLLTTR